MRTQRGQEGEEKGEGGSVRARVGVLFPIIYSAIPAHTSKEKMTTDPSSGTKFKGGKLSLSTPAV